MKIFSFSTFFNENDIFDIKYMTEKDWVDKICILEADRTFRNRIKPYNFVPGVAVDPGKIEYRQMQAGKKFVSGDLKGKLRLAYKRFCFYQKIIAHPAWYNEMIQRSGLVTRGGGTF